MKLGEQSSRYGLLSWDYKKTKSEATLVLYRHYIYIKDWVTGRLSHKRLRQCVSKPSMGWLMLGRVLSKLQKCNWLLGVVVDWTDVSSGTGHWWDHKWYCADGLINWCLRCCVCRYADDHFLFTLDAMFDVIVLYDWIARISMTVLWCGWTNGLY